MTARRGPLVALGVVGVLVAGLVAALVVLLLGNAADQRTEKARTAALQAAGKDFTQILSYDYRTLDKDLAASRDLTTGQFRTDFDTLVARRIRPEAPGAQTVTKATATPGGVVSASATSVDVLLFVDQTSTGKTLTAPRLTTSSVLVTMQKVGDRWLVANVLLVPGAPTSTTPAPSGGPSSSATSRATTPATTPAPSTSSAR